MAIDSMHGVSGIRFNTIDNITVSWFWGFDGLQTMGLIPEP